MELARVLLSLLPLFLLAVNFCFSRPLRLAPRQESRSQSVDPPSFSRLSDDPETIGEAQRTIVSASFHGASGLDEPAVSSSGLPSESRSLKMTPAMGDRDVKKIEQMSHLRKISFPSFERDWMDLQEIHPQLQSQNLDHSVSALGELAAQTTRQRRADPHPLSSEGKISFDEFSRKMKSNPRDLPPVDELSTTTERFPRSSGKIWVDLEKDLKSEFVTLENSHKKAKEEILQAVRIGNRNAEKILSQVNETNVAVLKNRAYLANMADDVHLPLSEIENISQALKAQNDDITILNAKVVGNYQTTVGIDGRIATLTKKVSGMEQHISDHSKMVSRCINGHREDFETLSEHLQNSGSSIMSEIRQLSQTMTVQAKVDSTAHQRIQSSLDLMKLQQNKTVEIQRVLERELSREFLAHNEIYKSEMESMLKKVLSELNVKQNFAEKIWHNMSKLFDKSYAQMQNLPTEANLKEWIRDLKSSLDVTNASMTSQTIYRLMLDTKDFQRKYETTTKAIYDLVDKLYSFVVRNSYAKNPDIDLVVKHEGYEKEKLGQAYSSWSNYTDYMSKQFYSELYTSPWLFVSALFNVLLLCITIIPLCVQNGFCSIKAYCKNRKAKSKARGDFEHTTMLRQNGETAESQRSGTCSKFTANPGLEMTPVKRVSPPSPSLSPLGLSPQLTVHNLDMEEICNGVAARLARRNQTHRVDSIYTIPALYHDDTVETSGEFLVRRGYVPETYSPRFGSLPANRRHPTSTSDMRSQTLKGKLPRQSELRNSRESLQGASRASPQEERQNGISE